MAVQTPSSVGTPPHLPRRIHMFIRNALAGAAVALACSATATSALAAPQKVVHRTPKVPIVVNGHHYKSQQIHRFDGRPLYSHPSKDGKTLIATTSLKRYNAFLARKGVKLPGAGAAHASSNG